MFSFCHLVPANSLAPSYLSLELNRWPNPDQLPQQLAFWLATCAGFSQIEISVGLDLIEARFYWQDQVFMMHLEHYSESCWIDTDREQSVVVMSELMDELQQHMKITPSV